MSHFGLSVGHIPFEFVKWMSAYCPTIIHYSLFKLYIIYLFIRYPFILFIIYYHFRLFVLNGAAGAPTVGATLPVGAPTLTSYLYPTPVPVWLARHIVQMLARRGNHLMLFNGTEGANNYMSRRGNVIGGPLPVPVIIISQYLFVIINRTLEKTFSFASLEGTSL